MSESFWKNKAGDETCLRLLTTDGHWLAYNDEKPDENSGEGQSRSGSCRQIEDSLKRILHATNVIILLGSGASFCADNGAEQSAPSMKDLWREVKAACDNHKHGSFDAIVQRLLGSDDIKDIGNIEQLLSHCKMTLEMAEARERINKPEDELLAALLGQQNADPNEDLKTFLTIAEATILKTVNFVSSSTGLAAHVELLTKFGRRGSDKPRVRIFTTNYDLCIEEAAVRINASLIDGFSHSARQRYNRDNFDYDLVRRKSSTTQIEYSEGVFHLYKLHGSVDWRRLDDHVIRSLSDDLKNLKPVLIYPRNSKYQEAFDSPYLDMFAALQSALREPDTAVLIAGFGFADDHISGPIWAALQSNLTMQLVLCDPMLVHNDNLVLGDHAIKADLSTLNSHQQRITNLAKLGDRRITVLNGRFEDLVRALPSIEGRTDRQRLEMLLSAVNKAVAE